MRILFDARSVRTAAGIYVFRGLTAAWVEDSRVERVFAAIRPGCDKALTVDGVEPVVVDSSNWLTHVTRRMPKLADARRADVIFVPNALAPRDGRAVAYFQDLSHFRSATLQYNDRRALIAKCLRATWRAVAAKSWMLAIPISEEIADDVRRCVSTPVVVIPNGVDVEPFYWDCTEDRIFVMGGTGARKDEATAVRAWSRVPAAVRKSTQLFLGGVEPLVRRIELEQLAAAVGVEASVSIRGSMAREEYLEHIARSRLAVSCSTFEAFGLPVAEAVALGAPVLCSAISSHIEILTRAGVGQVFAPGSVDELSRLIIAALDGAGPPRLSQAPSDWSWRARGRQHVDAYLNYM